MKHMILIPEDEYVALKAEVTQLRQDLAEALRRLNQDSSNSNLPPSSDMFKKNPIVNSREKTDKKSGGQPGHKGANLKQTDTPDIIETHSPTTCSGCDFDIGNVPVDAFTKRQEINVEAYKYTKEHRSESKICPCCGKKNVGQFPKHINGPVQYGATIQADIVYAVLHQMVSFKRFRQEMQSRYGLTISDGTICNIIETLANNLASFEAELIQYLIKSLIAHFDESGVNINGKNHWMFVMSDEFVSLFKAHQNRSEKALQDIDMFFHFEGLSVHDCYPMYFKNTNCDHALCHAHLARELKSALEMDSNEIWAQELKGFFSNANEMRSTFDPKTIEVKRLEFLTIIQKGFAYHEGLEPLVKKNKRGAAPQRKSKNLLDRFVKYENAVLRFMSDPTVPFTNNQAERDLRMIKVKMKVSIFRSKDFADKYALIRSYIETAKKLGVDVFEALIDALKGNPFSISEKMLLSP